ncbi:NfeD family protein [Aestuariirhabdus sp. Z084]|uniref:NfeD family protein n=1 Tax=Aestuariirhabdus haliotis TaxID=2918751 RepID=UPI00201B4134|nr:NfeD family protein [Aestuariirhabdus haliotis]MCL6415703.1 NfeD family protein [Aestuariirhabdus haliotis]MCL6419771.1 NfeD family protein [Aestuariirhabdus haliotis]
MIEYIVNHQAEFWLVLGLALLAVEVLTGFVTGVFLFAGLGALASGALMSLTLIPETWTAGVACTGISTGIITALLWRPLKRLQGGRKSQKDNSSDFIGHEFVLESDISATQPGSTLYSGITWKVEVDHKAGVSEIKAGQRVAVTSVDVGRFRVKPV